MRSCLKSRGLIHASAMEGRRKCGTRLASALQLVMSWTEWHSWKARTPRQCGEAETCPLRRKALRCRAPHLARTSQSHETLLERIPTLSDVQSAWALLLHCANATYLLRVVRPEMVHRFTEGHDHGLWRCLSTILRVHPEQCDPAARDAPTLPLFWEGWDCAAPSGPKIQLSGPVGRTPSP